MRACVHMCDLACVVLAVCVLAALGMLTEYQLLSTIDQIKGTCSCCVPQAIIHGRAGGWVVRLCQKGKLHVGCMCML
jgi:hypothetical protein